MSEIDPIDQAFMDYAGDTGDAPAPVEPEQPEVEETVERPRDERGRFTTEQPEDAVEETVETAETLLLGKYKSVEELEKAHEALQSRLGQMGDELGQLRSVVEQVSTPHPPPVNPNDFARIIDEDPGRAAQIAMQSRDPVLYEQAMEAWYDIAPKAATRFEMQQMAQWQQAQVQQQLAPTLQPLQAQHEQMIVAQTVQNVRQRHADLEQFIPQIQELAERFPYLQQPLAHGTLQERENALEALYFAARGYAGNSAPPAQPEPVVATAPAPQAPRVPVVASAAQIADGPARTIPQSVQDIYDAWDAAMPARD